MSMTLHKKISGSTRNSAFLPKLNGCISQNLKATRSSQPVKIQNKLSSMSPTHLTTCQSSTPNHTSTKHNSVLFQTEIESPIKISKNSTNNINARYNYTPALTEANVYKKPQKKTMKEKQDSLFNKGYGMTTFYRNLYENTKKQKNLSLEEYQNKILGLCTVLNLNKDRFNDGSGRFREGRREAESVQPGPKINFDIGEESAKNQNKKVSNRKIGLKEYLMNRNNKDAFEIEMNSINKLNYQSYVHRQTSASKIFNIGPEYILETFKKKMKLHI